MYLYPVAFSLHVIMSIAPAWVDGASGIDSRMQLLRQLTLSDVQRLKSGANASDVSGNAVVATPHPGTIPSSASLSMDRTAIEEGIINQIKDYILNMTGRGPAPANRPGGREGKDSTPSPTRSQPGMSRGSSGRESSTFVSVFQVPLEKNKILEYPDAVPEIDERNGVVQFTLHLEGGPRRNEVINAAMLQLHVRCHKSSTPSNKPKKSRKRISISVFEEDVPRSGTEGQSVRAETQEIQPIAKLEILARHTKSHNLLLPTSIIEKVLEKPDKKLRLRIVCERCDATTEVVTNFAEGKGRSRKRLREKSGKTKSGGQLKRRNGARPNRRAPILILQTKLKPARKLV